MLALCLTLAALTAALIVAPRPPIWWLLPVALGAGALLSTPSLFILQKVVSRLAMPPGLLWLALLVGLAVAFHHAAGYRWALLGFTVIYTLAGNVWIGSTLLHRLEAQVQYAPLEVPLDALWVLGGGTSLRPDGSPQLGPAGDRVTSAARLYHQGKVKRLLASGTSVAGIQQAHARDLGAETATIWRELGVPAAAIQTVPGPRNTLEELAALSALVQTHRWARVGLLTSAWHLPRALRHAHRHQLVVIPVGSDFRGERPSFGVVGLIPSSPGFDRVRVALREQLGAAMGR
jgi:uncharacterized SAM-binding protein YcdF (DUF218 family)